MDDATTPTQRELALTARVMALGQTLALLTEALVLRGGLNGPLIELLEERLTHATPLPEGYPLAQGWGDGPRQQLANLAAEAASELLSAARRAVRP